jgi:dolichol-phosphate mannosyltransferase
MAKTNNPLFYFGSVGLGSTVVGFLLGAYVAYDWVVNSISHEVIAVIGSFAILLGIQLLMFGVLSDMLVAVNREQTRRLEDIAVQLTHESRNRPADVFDDQQVDGSTDDAETEPAVSPHQPDE